MKLVKKSNTPPKRRHYPLAGLAMCFIGPVMALEPVNPTPPLVGHMPTVDNVNISPATPTLGQELSVSYIYNDVDGDADASTFKWLYNGTAVAGQTAKQYTPVLNINTGVGNACGDFQVAAEVTAQSQTGDPKLGTAKASAPVSVQLPTIPGFTFPDVTPLNWGDARQFCEAKGMQLPTIDQLQTVFNTYTSGGTNNKLAEKYGWPLYSRCGGSVGEYWTREGASGQRYIVTMYNGLAGSYDDTNYYQVTCVPGPGPAQLPTQVVLTHTSSGSLDLNGAGFADRPVVTVDTITANLTFVPDTQTDLANYRFEWFAGGQSTNVIKDGDNTFIPRVQDQGKAIKVVVTLKP